MRPAPGSVVEAGPVTIEARIVSSSPAVRTVELRVDGRPHEVQSAREDSARTVSATVELPAGPHTAQVVVWDDAGRSTQAWWRFEVGTTDAAAEAEETTSLSAGGPRTGLDLEPAPGSDAFSRERLPVSETEEGFLLAQAVSAAVGEGALFTYTLEVEPGVGVDPHAFADEAERILSDPRGWTGQGEFALQRVETAAAAIRVVLASPQTVDRFCAEVGLDTEGLYSCWNGRLAMLNVERWLDAVETFEGDITTYRTYLVNHEFGHGLGFGHVNCPVPGELAPVMQQQSIDLEGCRPNGWPFPQD